MDLIYYFYTLSFSQLSRIVNRGTKTDRQTDRIRRRRQKRATEIATRKTKTQGATDRQTDRHRKADETAIERQDTNDTNRQTHR